jgi:quercetin dioxygenase-like cupin family protein
MNQTSTQMSHLTIKNKNIQEEYLQAESNPHIGLFVHLVLMKPGTAIQSHKHESTQETIEVLKGKGFLCINGFVKEIKAGSKEVILPGQIHNFYTRGGTLQDPLVFKRIKQNSHHRDYFTT